MPFQRETELLIRYLEERCTQDPAAQPLLDAFPSSGRLTEEWLAEYAKLWRTIDDSRHILRAVLGEPGVAPWRKAAPPSEEYRLTRALEVLTLDPEGYLATWESMGESAGAIPLEIVPRPIRRMTGHAKSAAHDTAIFIARAAQQRLRDPRALDLADTLTDRWRWPTERFIAWLSGTSIPQRGETRHLFSHPDRTIRGHNLIGFFAGLREADLQNGRAQNQLPAPLLNRLKINRSLPELEMVADLLDLRHRGLVSEFPDEWEDTYQDIRAALDTGRCERAWRRCAGYGFLDPGASEELQVLRDRGIRRSSAYTGLLFNMTRRLEILADEPEMERFLHAYRSVDREKLLDQVCDHAEQYASGISWAIRELTATRTVEGAMIMRDMGNVAFHTWHQTQLGREQWEALPPVARIHFGGIDPRQQGQGGGTSGAGSKRREKTPLGRPRKPYPELEQALAETQAPEHDPQPEM